MTRIPWVRKAIGSEKSSPYCFLIVFAALVLPTLARMIVAPYAPNLVFVTYYPAILVCSLLTNWRYGLVCAVLSGIIALTLFPSGDGVGPSGSILLVGFALYLASSGLIVATAETLRRSIRELDMANSNARALNSELQHRVRNTLSVVQGLVSLTADATGPEGFVTAFSGRLQALSKAHDLLGQKAVGTANLSALVDEACRPFDEGRKIVRTGPACLLPTESCVPLALALHELCTNASKYGALSSAEGRVMISWTYSGALRRVDIFWEESGGPPVRPPSRKGLGSAMLSSQLGLAEVKLNFAETGVRCKLSIDGVEPLGARSMDVSSAPVRALPSMR